MNQQSLTQEDAIEFLLANIKSTLSGEPRATDITDYGFDLYLPKVMRLWMRDLVGKEIHGTREEHELFQQISEVFYTAAWELCRRGILLPGIKSYSASLGMSSNNQVNNGYSITSLGKKYVQDMDKYTLLTTNPTRFGEIIKQYEPRFKLGYFQRAMEAIACYNANNYLACCVMCGAAAESILLNLAIAKVGDEDAVIKDYRKSNGRSLIENKVKHGKKQGVIEGVNGLMDLMKYWRDEAAHGRSTSITEFEAYLSLTHLLKASQLCNDNYEELIS